MMTLQLALLASTIAVAGGWISTSQASYGAQVADFRSGSSTANAFGSLGWLWTHPADHDDPTGLGQSITWAWDPGLCDHLEPKFRDHFYGISFIDCHNLKVAMTRAFATWSQNHPDITFRDVSGLCVATGELASSPSGCSHAEVWVTFRRNESTPGTVAALTRPTYRLSNTFRYTNGEMPRLTIGRLILPRQVFEVQGGTIAFTDDVCWYLDSTFCAGFHRFKQRASASSVLHAGLFLLFFLWTLAVLLIIARFIRDVRRQLHRRFDALKEINASGSPEANEVAKQLAERTYWRTQAVIAAIAGESLCGTTLRWIVLLMPWAFYEAIFVTCWRCYDFEATAAQQIGLLLGLNHPDKAGEQLLSGYEHRAPSTKSTYNALLASGTAFNASSCLTPWENVEPGLPGDINASGTRSALMDEMTPHNPSTCLHQDDYEGLLTLYPVCTPMPPSPVCLKSEINIGVIRTFIFLIGPSLLAFLIALAIHFCIDPKDPHRLKRLAIAIRETHVLPASPRATPRTNTARIADASADDVAEEAQPSAQPSSTAVIAAA